MIAKSYLEKVFLVNDSDSRVRDPNDMSRALRYKAGDNIPAGKNVGDPIVIPKLAEIRVTDTRTDADRNVFVFAEPINGAGAQPFGWTRATNLRGQFMNETIGSSPADWVLFPQGNNLTVVDAQATIRKGPPGFQSVGSSIPRGTFVAVTERKTTEAGSFSKVSQASLEGNGIKVGDEIGWTKDVNLAEGWSEEYKVAGFGNPEGQNAAWRSGSFIGQRVLVGIVGSGGQSENVTLANIEAYMQLKEALATNDNIILGIESGFRSFSKQKELFDLFKHHNGNLAAEPGKSNHQHGQAFDLNTTDKIFDKSNPPDPVYRALKKNGPALGFIRTVSGEPWHWEFRPADAAKHGFKMPGVNP
jgi:D-alanyl-D-alanine carboxypeptidase-like protein